MNYYEELYHHGVKGMKWGIRRKRKNSAKKIEKLKKYRDSELGYYSRMAKNEKRDAEYADNYLKTLKKEGSKGETMKKLYNVSDDKSSKELYDQSLNDLWKDTISSFKKDKEIAIARGEAFSKKEKALMELDLTTAKKKDIRRAGGS